MSQKVSDIYITTREHESLSWLIEDTRERNGEVDQENLVNRIDVACCYFGPSIGQLES
jgi:hypothetical protein